MDMPKTRTASPVPPPRGAPHRITPCLWFDDNAEEAVAFYVSVFLKSRVVNITRYPRSDHPAHVGRAGQVMVIAFDLAGQRYTALNGGPYFKFNEAVS